MCIRDRDEYFLGSTYFAKQYAAGDNATEPRDYTYNYGILVDMIGDKDLQLYQERNSLSFPATRPLVQSIWATAAKMRVREFIARPNTEVLDDHLPLNRIAKIPTCDIIDFDYPNPRARFSYWHTTQDTADKCSGASLEKVGKVVLQWLRLIQKQPAKKGPK